MLKGIKEAVTSIFLFIIKVIQEITNLLYLSRALCIGVITSDMISTAAFFAN